MLNTTLLIKMSGDICNYTNQAKLLANKIITGMRYCNCKIINEKEEIYFIINEENKIYIELLYKKESFWLVNIYNHNEKDKDILINTISNDSTFEKVIIIFDSVSNKLLTHNYSLLNQMENKLRSEFCCAIINKWNLDIFDIIKKLSVKDEVRFESYNLPKNLNTKLQRLGLIELISYMNEHRLGGDEFKTYSDCFFSCSSKKNYLDFEEILKTDIFKTVSSNIKNKDNIKNVRNVICHNNIVNIDNFNNIIDEVNKTNNLIEKGYNNSFKNIFKDDVYNKKHITMLISNDNYNVDIHEFKLKFSQILNVCGYIYNNIVNSEIIDKLDDIEIGYLLSQSNEDGITIKLKYKRDSINNSGIYIVCIIFEDEVKQSVIAELRDKLIRKVEANDVIIMNDYVSTQYCNELYYKINYIENIVRSYIAIFYFFKGLDLNKIGIEKNKNDNTLSANNNNNLYNCDFIYLRNILENPPESRKVIDLVNQLRTNLKDGNYKIIEDRLKNISDTNAEVGDVLKLWGDLYKYRTIVAHSEYISKREFEDITEIIDETLEIVEKIFFAEIHSIFELDDKYSDEFKVSFFENKLELKICYTTKTITLKLEGNTYDFQGLGITRLQRLLREIVGNNNEIVFSYILTIESVECFIKNNLDKFQQLLKNKDYPQLINNEIVKLGYTKYANYRVVSGKEDVLEERIGELLKSIEKKIREIEDETCATKSEES